MLMVLFRKTSKLSFITLMLVIATGCATSRGVIDIVDEISLNPEAGQAIKFVRVTDNRDFQLNPDRQTFRRSNMVKSTTPVLQKGQLHESATHMAKP